VAVHAYIQVTIGQVTEALGLLVQIARIQPDIPYLRWLDTWKARPGLVTAVSPDAICDIVHWLYEQLEEDLLSPAAQAALRSALRAFSIAEEGHPSHAQLWSIHSMMLRKLDDYAAALAVAQDGHRHAPSWWTAVALRCALSPIKYGVMTPDPAQPFRCRQVQ
jgi:hypothetical protein